jgi:hypothetical protein
MPDLLLIWWTGESTQRIRICWVQNKSWCWKSPVANGRGSWPHLIGRRLITCHVWYGFRLPLISPKTIVRQLRVLLKLVQVYEHFVGRDWLCICLDCAEILVIISSCEVWCETFRSDVLSVWTSFEFWGSLLHIIPSRVIYLQTGV